MWTLLRGWVVLEMVIAISFGILWILCISESYALPVLVGGFAFLTTFSAWYFELLPLCNVGLHREVFIGFEDTLFTGELIPFGGKAVYICIHCHRVNIFDYCHRLFGASQTFPLRTLPHDKQTKCIHALRSKGNNAEKEA